MSEGAADRNDQLQLLSYLHTAVAFLIVFVSLVPMVLLGVSAEVGSGDLVRTEGARATESFTRALGVALVVAGIGTAAFVIWGARALAKRRGWALAVVSTVVLCCFFPLGTLLGGYTLTRLFDPPTRASFT